MSNNLLLNPGSGPNAIATVDQGITFAGYTTNAGHLQLGALFVGPDANTKPTPVTGANPLPIIVQAGSAVMGAITQSGGPWTQNLTQVGGAAVSLGQATMANSVPVALASNQSAIPATQSGSWSMTINAGAATIGAVTQASGPWTVNATQIGGSALALGQATMANSIPVAIASNQGAFPVSQSGSNWTQNLVQVNGTTIDTNSGVKSAGTVRVVLATDQPALTNSQPVNVNQIGGSALAFGQATMASSIPVTIASNQAAIPVSQSGSNWTVNQTQWNGTTVDTNSGNKSAGTVRVVLATDQPSMTNAQPVSQAVSPWGVNLVPTSTPALSVFRSIWPGATNGTAVKGSAGGVYYLVASNTGTSIRFIKLYNKASAPTVGTDTPSHTWGIAGSGVLNIPIAHGIAFSTGIGIGVSTGVADSDTGAPGANEVCVNLYFV